MNSFGRIFRVSVFGESHGKGVGALIDGTPPGIELTEDDFQSDLRRRKSGAPGTTARIEDDLPMLNAGVFNSHTTGAPILVQFENKNTVSSAYDGFGDMPRPGHCDLTAKIKYQGFNDPRGGGAFSGRLTLGLVAAGVIAKKIVPEMRIEARIVETDGIPMEKRLEQAKAEGDSVGGLIECRISGIKAGLGEPFFDSVESMLSHMIFSIPGIRGIEFGHGFGVVKDNGSFVNDLIIDRDGRTETNHAGGINGGISNGNEIVFRVAVKPTASIAKPQMTFNFKTDKVEELKIGGRHDLCFALRVPVIVEAAAAIVLADLYLIDKGQGE